MQIKQLVDDCQFSETNFICIIAQNNISQRRLSHAIVLQCKVSRPLKNLS